MGPFKKSAKTKRANERRKKRTIERLEDRQLMAVVTAESVFNTNQFAENFEPAADAAVEGFVAACDEAGGGLSTDPDGTIVCTVYADAQAHNRTVDDRAGAQPAANASVEDFVAACDDAGGGLSTDPDGTTVCTVYEDAQAADRTLVHRVTGDLGTTEEPAINARIATKEELAIVAPISIQAGVVTVHGTNDNDIVTVHYVDAPEGTVSSSQSDWIRVRRISSTGTLTQYFETAEVTALDVYLYGGKDAFVNQTNIASTANGGADGDILIGGGATDDLQGGDGNDHLLGRGGNDVLDGEAGNDRLEGGEGDDFLVGAEGDDRLEGGDDDDGLFGGANDDLLVGGAGDDILAGGDGADTLLGGSGRDILIGGFGRDDLDGGRGQDLIVGGALGFLAPHAALHDIWAEWTSDHSLAHRSRNVLGSPHPQFGERLNGNTFLDATTVIDDGALDEYIAHIGDGEDLLLVGDFDDYLPLGPGDVAVQL